jgi:hypothetical protein
VRSSNSIKHIPSSLGSDCNLVSPTITNSSNLFEPLLLLQELEPLSNGLGLGVDCSWEFLKELGSFLVTPVDQRFLFTYHLISGRVDLLVGTGEHVSSGIVPL